MVKSKKGRLGICCYGRSEMEYLVPLFCRYFDKYLEIVPLEEKDLIHLRTLEDVPDVILTTYITYDSVRAHFPHKKVLTMKRFLTGQNVESVIRLPEGTKALVVNWPERAAQEVVRELELQGIHHIHMTPYWPDSNIKISDYSAVIYTGSSYFPKGDFQYINLGHRTVALSTLIEIIQEFNLPAVCGEQFYYDNVERIIHGSFRLNRLLNATQEMRSNIERICDLNKNAVFAYDENEKITYFNPAAEKLFQIQNRRELLHRPLKTVLREYGGLVSQLLSKKAIEEMMVKIHGAEALVTTSVYETENGPNTMVNIMLLEDFQQAASNARSKLKTRDFIAKYRFDNILGDSSDILQAVKIAKTYAYSDATVLITGESGVGKELFAQSIHNASKRAKQPFVAVNFAALPESLAESELFGYTEGAFTGALRGGKRGLFEIAHQGTIFLDEIGDAPLSLQTKLLRVLEEREIVRIGGSNVIPIDIRVICATNRNLKEMMREGKFREDLYYRIKILSLHIPPLRERRSDIEEILRRMLGEFENTELLNGEILQALTSYTWPGNIRELKGVVEYIGMLENLREHREYDKISAQKMLMEFIGTNLHLYDYESESGHQEESAFSEDASSSEIDMTLYEILLAIDELKKQNIIVGRGSLSRTERMQRAGLSESKLKVRLKHLKQLNLIEVGITKQGVSLSETGRALLYSKGQI